MQREYSIDFYQVLVCWSIWKRVLDFIYYSPPPSDQNEKGWVALSLQTHKGHKGELKRMQSMAQVDFIAGVTS